MQIPTSVKRVGLVLGIVLAVASRALDAVDAASLGLSYGWWTTIGLGVFLACVAKMVWHAEVRATTSLGPQGPSGPRIDQRKLKRDKRIIYKEEVARSGKSLGHEDLEERALEMQRKWTRIEQSRDAAPTQKQRPANPVDSQPEVIKQPPKILANNNVRITESRSELRSIAEELGRYEVVWALWHTANHAYNDEAWGDIRLEKLVLLHPDGEYLQLLAPHFSRTTDELLVIIIKATSAAQKAGVNVRWYDGPIPFNLTIGNPRAEFGSEARVELVFPTMGTNERPTIYVQKGRNASFDRLATYFTNVWEAGVAPKG